MCLILCSDTYVHGCSQVQPSEPIWNLDWTSATQAAEIGLDMVLRI